VTPEELRLECLKLVQQSANASGLLLEPSQIISRARTYADFVMNWRGEDSAGSLDSERTLEMTPDGFRKHRPAEEPLQSRRDGAAEVARAGER
jgi:hypothetical protein